jgi:Arc/MetJ-type ribon-helix-helix transcriptional regulator
MAKKVTITLDDEVLAFVDQQAAMTSNKANRSGFINAVLAELQRQQLQADLEAAYRRDAQDRAYQEEVSAWDSLAADGLDA